MSRGPRKQRGQILIIVGLSLIVLVGMVGVALDSGRGYAVKAKLNAAVDAASIAAARAISEGDTDAARIANAQAAARRFFDLNFPPTYFNAARPTPVVNAVRDAERRWAVTVSATAEMPTTFARVLGRQELDVFARGQTVRRQLDVMLVIDVSGSLGPPTSPSTTFPRLKQAAINGFVSKFSPDDDRVGLVSFSSGAVIDVPIRKAPPPALGRGFNETQVANAINALPLGGATAAAEGMRLGLSELDAIPTTLRSDLRVILFFSDGAPNQISASFPRSSGSPNPISGNLYSETGPSGSGGNTAYRMWNRDQRFVSWNSSDPPNSGTSITNITSLPNIGRGGVSLASYPGHPRPRTLTGSPYANTRCNVNRAARNMVENIANTARGQSPPIYVYTIGLGVQLEDLEIDFSCGGYTVATEKGSVILNRLANTTSSDTRNASQPTGQYCFAQTDSQLESCFSRIASEVLRLAI